MAKRVNSAVETVGLDLGYGVTKALTDTAVVRFPSVAGHAREIKFKAEELSEKYPGDQVTDDEGSWFVGDMALKQVPAGELIRLRGRTNNDDVANAFRVRLMKVALGKLFAGNTSGDAVHIQIATGLPVDHMPDAARLKAALIGQHPIRTDSAFFIANITEVMVMPQPQGTIYNEMILPNGQLNPKYNSIRTGVVDVGTYTVDITLDDDGEYIDAESGSVEAGLHTAQDRIAEKLEADYREKFSYGVVEKVLRTGFFRTAGKNIDYRQDVEDALRPLRDATLSLMSAKWRTGVTIDTILLSGGGAALVEKVVSANYKQARLAGEDAQLSNARGYLNYANFIKQQA